MKKTIPLAAGLSFLLLAGAASAQSTSTDITNKAKSVGESTGVNSVIGVSPTTPDFIHQVALSDMFEIQSSQLATTKGNAAVKSFANQMITDHHKTTAELTTMLQTGATGTTPPTALDSSHQSTLDTLKTESGNQFNRTYASDQVSAHKDAVSLFQRYAKGGDNPALKAWAAKTLPTLQNHLKMAQALKS